MANVDEPRKKRKRVYKKVEIKSRRAYAKPFIAVILLVAGISGETVEKVLEEYDLVTEGYKNGES